SCPGLCIAIRPSENGNHLVFGHSSAYIAHLLSGRAPKKRTRGQSDRRCGGIKRSDQKADGNHLLQQGVTLRKSILRYDRGPQKFSVAAALLSHRGGLGEPD